MKDDELIPAGVRELRATMTEATMTEERGGNLHFRGYAAVYNTDSAVMAVRQGGQVRKFVERNQGDSFDRILRTHPDIRLLGLNHDENHVLARTKSGTLEASHDKRGLILDAPSLAPTSYALELRSMVDRGDVDAMSYGFTAAENGVQWDHSNPALSRRTLTDYSALWDGAPVTFPAFDATEASFRALERELRSGALSARELRALLDVVEPLGGAQDAGDALSAGKEQRAAPCPGCGGSGDCPSCAGTGKAGRTQRSARATQMDCAACYGSGTCRGCAGMGVTPNADGPGPDEPDYRALAARREMRRRLLAVAR